MLLSVNFVVAVVSLEALGEIKIKIYGKPPYNFDELVSTSFLPCHTLSKTHLGFVFVPLFFRFLFTFLIFTYKNNNNNNNNTASLKSQ